MTQYTVDPDSVAAFPNAAKFDPQKIGEALEAVRQQHDGKLRPEDVLTAAKDPANPLHAHIEWNVERAAYAYQLNQVRAIVRIVRVETGSGEIHRAFVSLRTDDSGKSYRSLGDVLASGNLRRALLRQAEEELAQWRRRYQELVDIVELVKPAQDALRRSQGEDRPTA